MNKNKPAPANLRAYYQTKFTQSRYNLILVIAMTVINIAIILFGGTTYFLFSATIPYDLVLDGVLFTGRLPAEYYVDWPETLAFYDSSYLTFMVVIAALILLVYLACFLFSKKFKTGWMLTAAILFVLDTLYMVFIYGIGVDSFVDILIHAWVLYYLISGTVSGFRLKSLPADEPAIEVPYVDITSANEEGSPAEEKAEVKIEVPTEEDN